MATTKTPEKALGIALKKAGSATSVNPAAIIAALPDNCQLLTDVKAFRDVLQEALDASVADLGPKVEAQRLPKALRARIAERLEELEV